MFGAKSIIFYTNGRGKGMSATPPTEFKVNAFTRENDDVCSYNHEYRESVGPGRYAVTNLVPERALDLTRRRSILTASCATTPHWRAAPAAPCVFSPGLLQQSHLWPVVVEIRNSSPNYSSPNLFAPAKSVALFPKYSFPANLLH